ncbi:uncharacterized protein LOC144987352 isoform X2 [Oryzias latipes]
MSSLQSLRELISERLAAAAEEIYRLCEGTIVQYEQELCRQRRLLDVIWKPQLQLHHIVLPQHWMTEEADQCNQQRNFRVEQEEPEPPQIKEEQDEPEPPQIKEEQEETEPPQIQEELQSFNVTDSQDEEGNQNEESTSTTDEETDPQNRDQRKRRDRSHVQSVDSSHMSAARCRSRSRDEVLGQVQSRDEPEMSQYSSEAGSTARCRSGSKGESSPSVG